MAQTLPHSERLCNAADFRLAYEHGVVIRCPGLTLYQRKNGGKVNRIGISVRNKICVNLVQRNRMKRLLRELFRQHKSAFGQGTDTIFVVKRIPNPLTLEKVKSVVLSNI